MVHVSHPYRTTGYTSVLTNLFLRSTLILLVSISFLLLNASLAIPILVLTSSKHLPSSEINEPKSKLANLFNALTFYCYVHSLSPISRDHHSLCLFNVYLHIIISEFLFHFTAQ